MTTQFKTNKCSGVFVEVPIEFTKFIIQKFSRAGYWLMETESKEFNHWKVSIPEGNYIFLFTTITASEEDAGKVVDEVMGGLAYANYNKIIRTMTQSTALSSLHSLMQSLGLDVQGKNYAVLCETKQ